MPPATGPVVSLLTLTDRANGLYAPPVGGTLFVAIIANVGMGAISRALTPQLP